MKEAICCLEMLALIFFMSGCGAEGYQGLWKLEEYKASGYYPKGEEQVWEKYGDTLSLYQGGTLEIESDTVSITRVLAHELNADVTPLTQEEADDCDRRLLLFGGESGSLLQSFVSSPDAFKVTMTSGGESDSAQSGYLIGNEFWFEKKGVGLLRLERKNPDSTGIQGEWIFADMAAVSPASSVTKDVLEKAFQGLTLTVSERELAECSVLIRKGYELQREALDEQGQADWYQTWYKDAAFQTIEKITLTGKLEGERYGMFHTEKAVFYQVGGDLWYECNDLIFRMVR